MRVSETGGVGQAGAPKAGRAAGGEGFQLPSVSQADAPAQGAAAARAGALVGVDALIALQDVGGPLERRRRSVRRAGRLLDVLDELKLALLAGELSGHDLQRLQRAMREQRETTDDPRLESLLDEIETRAQVELAKLEIARAA
ncbi:flagellar assembly protein FliX [Phenylobacterium sp.]|uniref:flagellar assembly regulator FliX n=1 Tax=Phenylobacterium sp. TaxID=1871053 RepID=UPI00262E3D30|nr:flagellar assembly protein FliX [Phenylobacterium sp.]